ncbi:MAG: ATP-dependent zinc protease [Agarilytica sp.]
MHDALNNTRSHYFAFPSKKVCLVLALVAVVGGCSFSQTRDKLYSEQNFELLQKQTTQIEKQEQKLESLTQEQNAVLLALQGLGERVDGLDNKMSQSLRAQAQAKKTAALAPTIKTSSVKKASPEKSFQGKAILGRVEYIWVDSLNHYLKARVDTGAKSSSLNASNIQRFERDGERWVKFDVYIDDDVVQSLEAPLHRHVRIRQASMSDLERRPVVKLAVQLGEITETTEFTLSDRNNMLYPILLGRSFLRDIVVVDVAKKFTRKRDGEKIAESKPTKSASQ